MTKLVTSGLIIAIIAVAGALFALKSEYTQSKMARLADCDDLPADVIPSISGAHQNIVLIGDSRAWEYGLWLKKNTDLKVLNLARPGETSKQTACKLERQISQLDESKVTSPDVVLLSLGINDLVTASLNRSKGRIAIESQAVRNVLAISERLLQHFGKALVISVVPPIEMDPLRRILWGPDIEDAAEAMNIELRSELPSGVQLLDLESVFFDATKDKWRKDLARDALHWNDNGYAKLHAKLDLRDLN